MDLVELRVVVIDDDPDILDLLEARLAAIDAFRVRIRSFQSADLGYQALLDEPPDVVLLDYQLDRRSGLDLLQDLRHAGFDRPVVILTASDDAHVAVELMKAGAVDYLNKRELTSSLLERALRYARRHALAAQNLEQSRQALADAEARARAIVETAGEGILTVDESGRIASFNLAAQRIFGLPAADALGLSAARLLPWPLPASNDGTPLQSKGFRRDGMPFPLEVTVTELKLRGRTQYTALVRDISERRQTEARIAETLAQLEASRDDLVSILNRLRLGAVMTDELGCVTFLNATGELLFGCNLEEALGRPWQDICGAQTHAELLDMIARPATAREKVTVQLLAPNGRNLWLDVDVHDDIRQPQRKILFFYDVSEVHDLRRQLQTRPRFHAFVGASPAMNHVYEQIQDLSTVESTVLIEGETGTGKELVARAIHETSRRKARPFITINCAGLTESILGSQLFGHRRGAFTGAIEDRKGLFESADGGTIFLDEIGDIPASVQTSLLRVLQEREVTRLGESTARRIDVRVLAATHRNLADEVEQGRFRLDLLYRIRVARIHLPPLRERGEDVALLARLFLDQSRTATGRPVQDLSAEAMAHLMRHTWPGNVRELKSAIEFAVIHCRRQTLQVEDLPPEVNGRGVMLRYSTGATSNGPPEPQDERGRILEALDRARGSRTAAARLLGVSRATFYRRLGELGVKLS
jgi:PAS domain S-box-containing protein